MTQKENIKCKMMEPKLSSIINECSKYIQQKEGEGHKSEIDVQYIAMAKNLLMYLHDIKNGKENKIPSAFYDSLIDSFDIYSDFWKSFLNFHENNSMYFE